MGILGPNVISLNPASLSLNRVHVAIPAHFAGSNKPPQEWKCPQRLMGMPCCEQQPGSALCPSEPPRPPAKLGEVNMKNSQQHGFKSEEAARPVFPQTRPPGESDAAESRGQAERPEGNHEFSLLSARVTPFAPVSRLVTPLEICENTACFWAETPHNRVA